MFACKYARQISAYHDGELPPARAAEVEKHLPACALCAEELKRLQAVSRLVASARIPQMSPALLGRLHGSVGSFNEVVVLRLARWATELAAAVLVACSLWIWSANGKLKPYEVSLESLQMTAMRLEVEAADGVSQEEMLAQWIAMNLSREDGID